jgi:membrane-associated protein
MTDTLARGLLAIGLLVFVKESGLPVPVPGDLVVIATGVAAARGQFDPVLALATILLAGLAGGALQFLLVRGVGRRFVLAVVARLGLGADGVERVAERLRRRGARGVALARATPGVRIIAIAASAVAALPFVTFLTGLAVGNTVFVAAHFLLGIVAGEAAVRVAGSALGPLAILGLGLAILGVAGWWLIRRRRLRSGALARSVPAATALAWADAACPACLAIAAIRERA